MHTSNAIHNPFGCLPAFLPKISANYTEKHQETVAFLPSANTSIASEKLLYDRDATAIEVTTFLRQQAKSKLQPILGAENLQVIKNHQQTDNLLPELKFCKWLQGTIKNSFNDFKLASTSIIYTHFNYYKDELEEIWEGYQIDEIIASQKTTLTDEEKYRIIKIKESFLDVSDDFNTLFRMVKNIFNNTGLSNNMDDFELLSFFMYWYQQHAGSSFKDENSFKYHHIYILLIVMLKSLDIDPHIIFNLNKQQASKFKLSCDLLSDILVTNFIFNITKKNDDILFRLDTLLLNSLYTLWVSFFTSDINDGIEFLKTSTVCIEKEQFSLIFAKYIADIIQDKIKPTEQKEASCINQQNFIQDKFYISKEKLYIGDEIEFCYYDSDKMSKKQYSTVASKWIQELKIILQKDNITDYNIECIECIDTIKYKITIGDWSYCLFFDINAPEVTTQPYRVEDKFCITENGQAKLYKTAELDDKYIFTISKHLNLKPRGCHKHFDVRAFEGNTELLMRLLLMVQNHPELPRFFNRLEDIFWYSYLTTKDACGKKYEAVSELSVHILNNVNDFLTKGADYQSKYGDNEDMTILAMMLYLIPCFAIAKKRSPIAYHHIINLTYATLDIMESPASTAEIRFFNVQNSNDLSLLNDFCILMLEKLIEDQKNKKPFEFVATKNPKDFTIEESRNLTENFLTELNMSEEYKARFRELSESLHQGNNN